MEYSLRREPWWNAVKRARSKRARAAPQGAAVVTLRLPAFRFLHFSFFVARMERSVIRGGRAAGYFVPGLRFAQSGLRNDETGVSEDESQAPPLTFSKPSRVRRSDRTSLAPRGMRRRVPFSQQCLVTKLERLS